MARLLCYALVLNYQDEDETIKTEAAKEWFVNLDHKHCAKIGKSFYSEPPGKLKIDPKLHFFRVFACTKIKDAPIMPGQTFLYELHGRN